MARFPLWEDYARCKSMALTSRADGGTEVKSPGLRSQLDRLDYLGIQGELTDSQVSLQELVSQPLPRLAIELWLKDLEYELVLTPAELLAILETLRMHPHSCKEIMGNTRLRHFDRTLANVAFRAASAVYDDARAALINGSIDVAVARLSVALEEMRFAIESGLLSETTLKVAYGKFATAVAFAGRWSQLSPDVLRLAIQFSESSFEIGNRDPTAVIYRLELLILAFDRTSDIAFLNLAKDLYRKLPDFAAGTELAQAEVRIRLSSLTNSDELKSTYLDTADTFLREAIVSSGFDAARKLSLMVLTREIREGRRVPATSLGMPTGLMAEVQRSGSIDSQVLIRQVLLELEPAWKVERNFSAAALAVRLRRSLLHIREATSLESDLIAYADVARWLAEDRNADRHYQWEAGAACLELAIATEDVELARSACHRFLHLCSVYPSWALPRIGLARVIDFLAPRESIVTGALPSSSEAWRTAANIAMTAPDYVERSLGGKNRVFAVDDVRGFMSDSFVFKQMPLFAAEFEAGMLRRVGEELVNRGLLGEFMVPASLALVPVGRASTDTTIHVIQRSQGTELASLDPKGKAEVLPKALRLLGVFHDIAGTPGDERSAWKPLKANLKMCLRTLVSTEECDEIVDVMKETLPPGLPLLMKRDAHRGNWLLDDVGRIVAIDMESRGFLPIGHDVAQLIEDSVMLPVSRESWSLRIQEWEAYQEHLGIRVPDSLSTTTYEWFALYRAIWLGSAPEASKAQKRHAGEIAAWLADTKSSKLKGLAARIRRILSHVQLQDGSEIESQPVNISLSRRLASVLRHNGPSMGIPIDESGFAQVELVAEGLGVTVSAVIDLVENPAEPRYQLVDDSIRALYGHSLPVHIDALISTERPDVLFHGSSWSNLDSIASVGITPMSRRLVHLSNSVAEAVEVGSRHGSPVVLEIRVDGDIDPTPVANGVWVTGTIPPRNLSVVNPYSKLERMIL